MENVIDLSAQEAALSKAEMRCVHCNMEKVKLRCLKPDETTELSSLILPIRNSSFPWIDLGILCKWQPEPESALKDALSSQLATGRVKALYFEHIIKMLEAGWHQSRSVWIWRITLIPLSVYIQISFIPVFFAFSLSMVHFISNWNLPDFTLQSLVMITFSLRVWICLYYRELPSWGSCAVS